MAKKKKRALTPAMVYARIRPIDTSGKSGHTADGEAASKFIKGFDRDSVTVEDTGRREMPKFQLSRVVQPESDQAHTFQTVMRESGLIADFITDTNVLFFAYGQTGSGKTHTMLGETSSLASSEPNDGWGLFPRVVHHTLDQMRAWRRSNTHAILTACAVEFYCQAAWDLDSKPKGPVTITAGADVWGATQTRVTAVSDLAEWLPRVYGNRYTAKTKMNEASSRSHCALILTLHKSEISRDGKGVEKYSKTTFSIVDMAGSERNDKTGAGERVNGNDALLEAMEMFKAGTPEKLSLAVQGFMINYELSFVQTEILKAGEMHRKGNTYKAQKAMSTAGSLYMTACCDGRARLGMVVTLSASPQHGFGSWFTLKYDSPDPSLTHARSPCARMCACTRLSHTCTHSPLPHSLLPNCIPSWKVR